MKKIFLFILISFLFGCVHRLEITNFDTGQTLEGEYNEIDRMVTVTMPNGEILTGKYTTVQNANFSFGTVQSYSGAVTSTGFAHFFSLGTQGQAYALLKSETSKLMMEIIVNYSGNNGFGEARTNDGRNYKVQF